MQQGIWGHTKTSAIKKNKPPRVFNCSARTMVGRILPDDVTENKELLKLACCRVTLCINRSGLNG
eukprot:scaffold15352_cov84-Phaeocystis_antarctica.AAC.1